MLAYLRTALGLIAGGCTLLQLFPNQLHMQILSVCLLVVGVALGAIGVERFKTVRAQLRKLMDGSQ
ncbi:hypothetical protein Q31a_03850 [Aureliella helgolandensis]|uniref:DUF202 domain-containing protein n=2 Tax=Aureliella helgolandensis TaxID=2527968 RepID=A0A518G0G9_9BACT|nr:hypothetical protein Q31a_03850 [Aureliella helgolandensis]